MRLVLLKRAALAACSFDPLSIMYLLYVDESGDLNAPDKEHIVVAGLIVHESDVRRLVRATEAVVAKNLDEHLRRLELHAQRIRTGGGPWHGIPRPVRQALLQDTATLLQTFEGAHPFALLAVVRSPGAVPYADPLERVYEELALRFNTFLSHHREMGIVIADEAKYANIVQPLVREWRDGKGTRFGRLTRLVEVPLFVDSKVSRPIQLADFVAHATWLTYESKEESLLVPLEERFRQLGGPMHGFVHLSADHRVCPCIACFDRRQRDLKVKLPFPDEPDG